MEQAFRALYREALERRKERRKEGRKRGKEEGREGRKDIDYIMYLNTFRRDINFHHNYAN